MGFHVAPLQNTRLEPMKKAYSSRDSGCVPEHQQEITNKSGWPPFAYWGRAHDVEVKVFSPMTVAWTMSAGA